MKAITHTRLINIALIAILITGFVGWVMNIAKLSTCDFEAPYRAEVIHTIGLIPIIGAVTGYMNLGQ